MGRQYEADPDFASYVRARGHELLRAAYLVCGDLDLATSLLEESLARLAGRWAQTEGEHPDAQVRRLLFRSAVSAVPSRDLKPDLDGERRVPPTGEGPVGRAEKGRIVLADEVAVIDEAPLRAALSRLTPTRRALLVLRLLEDCSERETSAILGHGTGEVGEQVASALAELGDEAPGVERASSGAGGDSPVWTAVLRELTEQVPEPAPGLADRAWARASRLRSHRQRVVAAIVAAVVALGAAGYAVTEGPPTGPVPVAEPTGLVIGGVQIDLAPSTAAQSLLPRMPGADAQGLPDRMTFDPGEALPTLTLLGGMDRPVRAVLLRTVGVGIYHPVLYLPGGPNPYVEVDSVTLGEVSGNEGMATSLGVRAINPDLRRVALVTPGHVFVVHVNTGVVQDIPVEDLSLQTGGWSFGGATVIARAPRATWRVDPETATTRLMVSTSYDGRRRVIVDQGAAIVNGYAFAGEVFYSADAPGPIAGTWGETVSNLEGWAGAGVLLDPGLDLAWGPRDQGMYAVQVDASAHARVLALEEVRGSAPGCCVALGWAADDVMLYRSDTATGSELMGWDVITGRVWRVSALPVAGGGIGAPGPDVALSP